MGRTLADISTNDPEEYEETGETFLMFMFADGSYIKVIIPGEFEAEYFDPDTAWRRAMSASTRCSQSNEEADHSHRDRRLRLE